MTCRPDSTHHHACDCREEYFDALKAENQRLREALEAISNIDIPTAHDMVRVKYTDDYEVGECEAVKIAKQALSEGREAK